MKFIFLRFLICFLLFAVAKVGDAQTVAIGGYSNIVTSMPEDPHQSGYAVTLFRKADGQLYGEFTYAPGTTEGFGGRLYDVHDDNGQISFKAKVSAGYSSAGGKDRTLFDFSGKWSRSAIAGTLKTWDGYKLNKPIKVEQIKLKRSRSIDMSPQEYDEYLKYSPAVNW